MQLVIVYDLLYMLLLSVIFDEFILKSFQMFFLLSLMLLKWFCNKNIEKKMQKKIPCRSLGYQIFGRSLGCYCIADVESRSLVDVKYLKKPFLVLHGWRLAYKWKKSTRTLAVYLQLESKYGNLPKRYLI